MRQQLLIGRTVIARGMIRSDTAFIHPKNAGVRPVDPRRPRLRAQQPEQRQRRGASGQGQREDAAPGYGLRTAGGQQPGGA